MTFRQYLHQVVNDKITLFGFLKERKHFENGNHLQNFNLV
jgi:hypothetical protein